MDSAQTEVGTTGTNQALREEQDWDGAKPFSVKVPPLQGTKALCWDKAGEELPAVISLLFLKPLKSLLQRLLISTVN